MAKKNKEALILEVHKRPLLWKEKMKNYKNKSFTDPLWQEVGAATKMSGTEAKKKFKNLKDSYRKERLKLRSGANDGVYPESRWPYYTMLGFLDSNIAASADDNLTDEVPVYETFLTTEYVEGEFRCDNPLGDGDDEMDDNRASTPPSSNTSLSLSKRSCTSCTQTPHKNRKLHDVCVSMLELEKQKIDLLKSKGDNATCGDADRNFLLSLAPYLHKLPSLERIKLRQKLQNEVIEALERQKEPSTVP